MNRIESVINGRIRNGKKLLVAYLTGCLPDLEGSLGYFQALSEGGADIIEIGVPFSDALADGPVNQKAALKAIENGASVAGIFKMVEMAGKVNGVPVILLVYYNTVFHYGVEKFCAECSACGVDGLVVPDLPLEEREELLMYTDKNGLCLIPLVAPTSGGRVSGITNGMKGFTYCVSSMGVTGERKSFRDETRSYIRHVKKESSLPVIVGFGITDRESAGIFYEEADGVIVGTAIVKRILAGESPDSIREFVAGLRYESVNHEPAL